MASDCPFCLENKLLKTAVMAETDHAFLTEALRFPGCYLVIPKRHTETLMDLPDGWWAEVKQALTHVPLPQSYNLALNYGLPAGQTVKHLHFWIVPRTEDTPSAGMGLVSLLSEKDAHA